MKSNVTPQPTRTFGAALRAIRTALQSLETTVTTLRQRVSTIEARPYWHVCDRWPNSELGVDGDHAVVITSDGRSIIVGQKHAGKWPQRPKEAK